MLFRSFIVVAGILVSVVSAFAGAGITYHGRLVNSSGVPVEEQVVQFKIQIRTPGSENCLLYQETHTRDMRGTDGIFALTINDGTASSLNTEPFSLDRVFQNRGTLTFAGGKCAVGNTYAPNPADGRRLFVDFTDGTFAGWETLPSQAINYVPMSMEAMTVGGYGSGSMLRVNDGTGAPASISALTQTQYNTFIDLLAGTSPLYLTSLSGLNGANLTAGSVDDTKLASGITGTKISGNITGNAAGFTGSLNGDVTGTQSATVVGKIQGRAVDSAAPSNGQVLKWNSGASRWEPGTVSAGGGGTVTSVTGTGSVVMTGTATDPIVGVQDASSSQKGVVQLATSGQNAANVVVQGNDSRLSDARTPTAHHHNVDEIDSAVGKYFLYKPNNAQCSDGQVLKWINANQRWECANDAGAAGTVASLTANSPIVKTGTSSDPIITVQDASTSQKGAVQLASSSDTTAGLAIQANDTRLTDARAPTAHHHNVDEIDSAAAKYFGYKPNNTACANNEILKWDNSNSRWICATAGSLVNAESTTASNVGTAGVGVFKQLSTYDLQLKKLNPAGAVTITDDTANSKIDIGLNLGGVFTNNTGLIVSDGTQLLNKACSANQVLKWLSPTGWTCAADDGLTSETDPKVGSNTLNYLSKWDGSALVASTVIDNGTSVGVGVSPTQKLHVAGNIYGTGTVMSDGDFFLSRTSLAYGYVTRPNSAGFKKLGFVVSGGGNLENFDVSADSSSFNGNVGIGTAAPASKLDVSGDIRLSLSGAPSYIYGDFSNPTFANRTIFKTITPNVNTVLVAVPDNTGGTNANPGAGYSAFNNPDPTNAGRVIMAVDQVNSYVKSERTGSGTYLPLSFYTSATERIRIDTAGNVGIGVTGPTAKLEVAGGIKPGNVTTGAACSPEGAFAYDATAHAPVFCNSSAVWAAVSGGGGAAVVLKAIRNYTSSTTWTKPAGLSYVVVEVWGGGAGGGSGSYPGGAGGASNFGGFVSANGGASGGSGWNPGAGGSASGDMAIAGTGGTITYTDGGGANMGGNGGAGAMGGGGGVRSGGPGVFPGGGGAGADGWSASGGGGGGYAKKLIQAASLGATATVTIGGAGSGGSYGAGGNGAGGMILVYEYGQ